MQDEAREGVDWHRDGEDVPWWALLLAGVATIGLWGGVVVLILLIGP